MINNRQARLHGLIFFPLRLIKEVDLAAGDTLEKSVKGLGSMMLASRKRSEDDMQEKLNERSEEMNETSPTPEQLKALRESHGLTELQAAYIVHVSAGTWQRWEAGNLEMSQKPYELFCTEIK